MDHNPPPSDPAHPTSLPRRCSACQSTTPIFPFSMAFQPIVDLRERRVDAYEALVRSPTGSGAAGVLAQVDAENLYKFDQACRVRAIELAASLGRRRHLRLNFLPHSVYEPRAWLRATLHGADRSGFPRDRLTFEIVETEAIADTDHLLNITREYRRQGFKVALDDFGTGYSGLARLALLKPDIVKLDRVVAQDCDKDPVRLAIVKSIIGLCDDIGVKTVIEGVERLGEVEALRSVGARFIQGFYFGRPLFEAIAKDSDIFPEDAP